MTKYKLNNTVRSSSEVTLTSYLGTESKKDESAYHIPDNENDNVNTESNRNLEAGQCHVCTHPCEFIQEPGKLAASLEKRSDKFGLNELKVENLDRNVCLCEKYNGGCKLCPRPSLAPTLALSLDAREACHTCHGGTCGSPYPSKLSLLFLIQHYLTLTYFALESFCKCK